MDHVNNAAGGVERERERWKGGSSAFSSRQDGWALWEKEADEEEEEEEDWTVCCGRTNNQKTDSYIYASFFCFAFLPSTTEESKENSTAKKTKK